MCNLSLKTNCTYPPNKEEEAYLSSLLIRIHTALHREKGVQSGIKLGTEFHSAHALVPPQVMREGNRGT
jgi:hypothetical protein